MADALPTADDAVTLTSGLRFPEGPVARPDGSVLFVELAREAVSRLEPDGTVSRVADVPGGPNGLAVAGEALLVCNNGGFFTWHDVGELVVPGETPETWDGGSIDRVDVATGEVTTLYTHGYERLQAPNDLVLDGHGGFWFTDHGVRQGSDSTNAHFPGLLYGRLDGSGVEGVVVGLDAANGVGLSPDGSLVHVAETHTGRVWSWPVVAPGEVGPHPDADPTAGHGGRLLYDAPDGHLFDSLAVDAGGCVVVGTLGAGGLTVIDPATGAAVHLALPDPLVTNVCFGGPDGRTAYCTGSGVGTLFALPWPRSGVELHTGGA
jgi:gluconolactonase